MAFILRKYAVGFIFVQVFLANFALSGAGFFAGSVCSPLTIDGRLEDWWSANPQPVWLGSQEQVKKSDWRGLSDLGGAAFFLYDDKALYLSAVIYDDKHTQPLTKDVWQKDSLQVAFDILGNATVPGYGENNIELGFALTPEGPRYECTYRNKIITDQDLGLIRTAIVRDEEACKTTYEIAIPWSVLKPYVPGSNRPMAVGLVVNDADNGDRGYLETGPGVTLSKDPMTFTPLYFEKSRASAQVSGFAFLPSFVREDMKKFPVDFLCLNTGPDLGRCLIDFSLDWRDKKIKSTKEVSLGRGLNRIVFKFPVAQVGIGPAAGTVHVTNGQGRFLDAIKFEGVTVKAGGEWSLGRLPELKSRAARLKGQVQKAIRAGWYCPRGKIAPVIVDYFESCIRAIAGSNPYRAVKMGKQLDELLRSGEEEVTTVLNDRLRPAQWPKWRVLPDPLKIRVRNNALMSEGRPIYIIGTYGEGAAIRDAKVLAEMGMNGVGEWVAPGSEQAGDGAIPHDKPMTGGPSLSDVNKEISGDAANFLRRTFDAGYKNKLAVDLVFYYYPYAPYPLPTDPTWKKPPCGTGSCVDLCCRDELTLDYCRKALKKFVEFVDHTPNSESLITWTFTNEVAMSEKCPKVQQEFREALKSRYGTIGKLNSEWGSKFGDFSEIGIPAKKEINRALWYEWWAFHDKVCTDFLLWMVETGRKFDANKSRLFQIKCDQDMYRLGNFQYGIDRERIAQATDIVGGDSDIHNLALKLDTIRAFGRGKPFYNGEFHVVFSADVNPDMVYAYHWQGAVHGQQGALSWLWTDAEHAASVVNNTRYRPNMAFLIGKACLDINRFAEEVQALSQAKGPAAIVYSRASRIQNEDPYVYDLARLHEALMRLGLVVEFVTERQLAEGVPGHLKALIFPQGTCLPADAYEWVLGFASRGGAVIRIGDALEKDSRYRNVPEKVSGSHVFKLKAGVSDQGYGIELASICKKIGIFLPLLRSSAEAKAQVEYRTVQMENRQIYYLCNMSDIFCTAEAGNGDFKATDLLGGTDVERSISLSPWCPRLLEGPVSKTGDLTFTLHTGKPKN